MTFKLTNVPYPLKSPLKLENPGEGKIDLSIDKSKFNKSAVDTNQGPNILKRKDLVKQHNINKKEEFDAKIKSGTSSGTISAPKHIEQAQAASRLNPISGPIVNTMSLFNKKK